MAGRKKAKAPEYDPDMPLSETIAKMRKDAREILRQSDELEKLLKYALGTERKREGGTDGIEN
ncbi:MAG: hypothetical protein LBS24_00660 [Clostridiales Family XIII bacterium]|nr:hypothetical protein [Clostridiales Family XIII bacterium]